MQITTALMQYQFDLFIRPEWSQFANCFGLVTFAGAVFAWLLIGTLELDTLLPLVREYHLFGK